MVSTIRLVAKIGALVIAIVLFIVFLLMYMGLI
jgi:hypothetical protein